MYSVPFLYFGWKFALFNLVAHFIVDFISSRVVAYFWHKDNKYASFAFIGLDQAIHLTILLLSYNILK
jgi:hypothetical protein